MRTSLKYMTLYAINSLPFKSSALSVWYLNISLDSLFATGLSTFELTYNIFGEGNG